MPFLSKVRCVIDSSYTAQGFSPVRLPLFSQFAFLGGSRSLWLHGIRQAVKKGNTSGEVPESSFQRTSVGEGRRACPLGGITFDIVYENEVWLWIKWQV